MTFIESILVSITSSLVTKLGEKLLSSPLSISPTVVAPQRKKLDDDFYEPHYQYASSIEVTGIALGGMIRYLGRMRDGITTLPKTHLVSNLKKRGLNVRLLLASPDSEFVEERMKLENNPHLQEDIRNNLIFLKELKEYINNLGNQDRLIQGSLEVRLLNNRLPFSHFNVKPVSMRKSSISYLGLILPGLRGEQCPLILIRDQAEQSDLYDVIDKQFFSLYSHDTTSIFLWERDHVS